MFKQEKVVIGAVIVLGLAILALFLFNKPKFQTYKVGPDGQPIGITFAPEEGRARKEFPGVPPKGFPRDFPVEAKPLQVFESYTETALGDSNEQERSHTQSTYVYLTARDSELLTRDFERYFKAKDYKFEKIKGEGKLLYSFYAEKDPDYTFTVIIYMENQFEWRVTASILNIERLK